MNPKKHPPANQNKKTYSECPTLVTTVNKLAKLNVTPANITNDTENTISFFDIRSIEEKVFKNTKYDDRLNYFCNIITS